MIFKLIEGVMRIVGVSGNIADVNAAGELKVVNEPPTPPVGTTPFTIVGSGEVIGNASEYTYYSIPNGETAILQRISGSAEGESRSKVEAYYDTTGVDGGNNVVPSGWVLIDVAYTDNNTFVYPQSSSTEYVGTAISRIVLRRKRMENGGREIFGKIEGYY